MNLNFLKTLWLEWLQGRRRGKRPTLLMPDLPLPQNPTDEEVIQAIISVPMHEASKNVIVLQSPIKGTLIGGVINDTSKPGSIMQIDASQQKYLSGRSYWKAANPGTDGLNGLYALLREDKKNGYPVGTAYVAGTPGELYFPLPGEEFNALVGEATGTGDTYAIGDKLVVYASGGFLVHAQYNPTAQAIYAVCMEVITQGAASLLVRCMKT